MSNRFALEDTPVSGLTILHRTVHRDPRGSFERIFCEEDLRTLLGARGVSQVNISSTQEVGAVRGMHFQFPPFAETKLITCMKGEIFDVAVDLRRGSSTFLRWFGIRLSERTPSSLLIPEGFAHGFQVVQPNSQVLYMHSAPYAADAQGAINAVDPKLDIHWPLPITLRSERDESLPLLDDSFTGVACARGGDR
jgi:dTDP-4-dehydrorhamnose 3,5-epimerase